MANRPGSRASQSAHERSPFPIMANNVMNPATTPRLIVRMPENRITSLVTSRNRVTKTTDNPTAHHPEAVWGRDRNLPDAGIMAHLLRRFHYTTQALGIQWPVDEDELRHVSSFGFLIKEFSPIQIWGWLQGQKGKDAHGKEPRKISVRRYRVVNSVRFSEPTRRFGKIDLIQQQNSQAGN